MLTFLLRYSTAVLLLALIAASGADVMKAVGDRVSFRPDKPLPPPVNSITWKHRNSADVVVKAIEWDEDGLSIPNPRFQDITTLDVKTGQINITDLKVEHSGVYTIEINSKEQGQRFTLIIKERVPKPEIRIEYKPDFVYLNCEYSEPITWKNSAGETLKGSPITKGESLTVIKNGDPENFYTCTLDNGASKETSDPVYERDLFKGSGIGAGGIAGIIIAIILLVCIIVGGIVLYKRNQQFKELVDGCPCIKVITEGRQNNNTEAPKTPGKDVETADVDRSSEGVPLNEERGEKGEENK